MADPKFVFECIKMHFIEENAKDWYTIANDIANNYHLYKDDEEGIIAGKNTGDGELYFIEVKALGTPKLVWVFKMLAILDTIKADKSIKKIYTHTKSLRVKAIMEKRGWKTKNFIEPAWEIYYENI